MYIHFIHPKYSDLDMCMYMRCRASQQATPSLKSLQSAHAPEIPSNVCSYNNLIFCLREGIL